MLEDEWLIDGLGLGGEDDYESGDPLNSLEESLESFEGMIGA